MRWTTRNIAAWLLSSYYLLIGKHKSVIKKCKAGEFIISVYFHNPSRAQFEGCIRWFKKHGFRFISVDDLIEIIERKLPVPKMTVLLTADDCWKENAINVVEVARIQNVPVKIFANLEPIENHDAYWWSYIDKANQMGVMNVTTQSLKNVSNDERLKQLEIAKKHIAPFQQAMTKEEVIKFDAVSPVKFGSHTITHPILPQCSDDVARFEIEESKRILESWLNRPINSFAYPNGCYSSREIDMLKTTGYKIAFTTRPEYIRLHHFESPFELPRFDVLEHVSMAENICRMTGIWFAGKKQPKWDF
jgi:peptidoglycan/xylan/chitin deacetylase (PgdA/CDA1 family)